MPFFIWRKRTRAYTQVKVTLGMDGKYRGPRVNPSGRLMRNHLKRRFFADHKYDGNINAVEILIKS